jgi:preprotein translocase subunit SecF
MIFGKLNLGIDMTGGISSEYSYTTIDQDLTTTNIAELADNFLHNGENIINATSVYKIS